MQCRKSDNQIIGNFYQSQYCKYHVNQDPDNEGLAVYTIYILTKKLFYMSWGISFLYEKFWVFFFSKRLYSTSTTIFFCLGNLF